MHGGVVHPEGRSRSQVVYAIPRDRGALLSRGGFHRSQEIRMNKFRGRDVFHETGVYTRLGYAARRGFACIFTSAAFLSDGLTDLVPPGSVPR